MGFGEVEQLVGGQDEAALAQAAAMQIGGAQKLGVEQDLRSTINDACHAGHRGSPNSHNCR